MRRIDLEHIVRAAAVVADVDEVIIVGSQSILGAYPDAPRELLVSQEADIYPKLQGRPWLPHSALLSCSMAQPSFTSLTPPTELSPGLSSFGGK